MCVFQLKQAMSKRHVEDTPKSEHKNNSIVINYDHSVLPPPPPPPPIIMNKNKEENIAINQIWLKKIISKS